MISVLRSVVPFLLRAGMACILVFTALELRAASNSAPTGPANDVLVLSNGDTLHGKLLREVAGKVTFHTESLGDLTVEWDKIRELHAGGRFAVLEKNIKMGRKAASQLVSGPVDVADQAVSIRNEAAPSAKIPVKKAEYIVDVDTLDKQMFHEPNLFTGWNGSATAGATLVQATQNQYTFSGGLALVRAVPSVTWLAPRNRTALDLSGSFGKITQPGTPPTKSSIYHADGERDQYLSTHLFVLAQTAFDHNYALDLDLQQIYGAGFGWTLFSTPLHEADLKATLQYEKQQFISGSAGTNQDLIGSTLSANYMRHMKLFTYSQSAQYIPAFNNPRAYSVSETNMFAFPAYKNFSFSMGTTDTYLNNPPIAIPPSIPPKRNSFQFTMGLTYAIKSKY